MQKKVKSRLSDISFCTVCILCSAFCIYGFINSLNKVSLKNEDPIATITFKYNTAQRKLFDDLIWDRLRQDSPIYNNDTIRTSNNSEAIIKFPDGNVIELGEVTMVQIALKEDGTEVDFQGGEISVETTQGSVLTINSEDSSVVVSENTGLSVKKEETTSFSVQNGIAQIISPAAAVPLELQRGQTSVILQSGEIKKSEIAVNSPVNNARFLNFSEEKLEIPFEWNCNQEQILLEISALKDFSEIVYRQTLNSDLEKISIPLESGTFYWRFKVLSEDSEDVSVNGKLSILYVDKPQLVSPKSEYTAEYRKNTPSIRFAWKESNFATSYGLVIADNPEMQNPIVTKRIMGTSCTITNLEEGNYYWQIIPYYKNVEENLSRESEIRSFTIVKNFTMKKTDLLLPKNDSVVTTKVPIDDNNFADQKVVFSWKNAPEAVSYQFKIWNSSSQNPYISENIKTNYYTLDTAEHPLEKGLWYWSVDTNYSKTDYVTSDIRTFYAVDSKLEQRTIYPPDNYRIAENRIQDLRFNWKSNVSSSSLFEIATDKKFKDIVYSETTQSLSLAGKKLEIGKYYWRVSTSLGDVELKTDPKLLNVEPLFDAPKAILPLDGQKIVIRPEMKNVFSWEKVEDADYYNFRLAKLSEPDTIIYERNYIEENESGEVLIEVDLNPYDEEYYVWTVQAYRNETELASKSNSYLSSFTFNMRKLKPIVLRRPANKTEFDGVDAIKQPGSIEWFCEDNAESSELVIYKDSISPKKIIFSVKNPKRTVQLPRLYEGTYFWKVNGLTFDGLDISSLETREFSVGSIEKLAAPSVLSPSESFEFNADYLRNNRFIQFKWNKIPEADQYIIRVYNENKKCIFENTVENNLTEFVMKDLSILKNGKYYWTVEAQSLYDGSLFQSGNTEQHHFEINIPEVKQIKIKKTGKMYGK